MRALLPVLLLAAAPAFAQVAPAPVTAQDEEGRYRACLAQTEQDADGALEAAMDWRAAGGDEHAMHCAAIAMLRLGYEGEAALGLEQLADEPLFAAPDAKAELLRQAASAWLIAGDLESAETNATAAMAAAPGMYDLILLRARVRLEAGNYAGAETDLTDALALNASSEAYTLRAQANFGQNSLTAALDDAQRAAEADPLNVDARLILGDVREAIRASNAAR